MSQQPPAGPPAGWQPPQQPPQWGPPPPPQGGPPQQPPGPPYGQQQPGWGPPQQRPPKPRRPWYLRWWSITLAILAILFIIGALAGDPPTDTTSGQAPVTTAAPDTSPVTDPPATEAPTTAKPTPTARQTDLRKPVRDGKFEFVVQSFRCGGGTCRGQVAVENIGDEAQTMFATNQYLFDVQDRRFEADSAASSDSLFLQDINPGLTAKGTIVWKVPSNFRADHLELHDSAFSGGVTVKL